MTSKTPTTIGAGLKLDGEKEFKKAISEINNGLKVTASELALVTAKYSDNASSVSALTAKQTVLENKINGQTEKIAKLRDALQATATKYGEADAKTMNWQVSLNKAETELIEMQKDLQNNGKQLDKAKQDMEKYGNSVDEVAKSQSTFGEKLSGIIEGLGINLPAGADKAIKSLDGTKASTLALVGVVAGLVTGLGKATIETAKYADEVMTMSKVTGLSTDTIQEMKYASELIDVSAETMTDSMAKMVRSMENARGGSKEAAEAFRTLHLRVTDGNGQLKNSEEMFYQIIDALGNMKNETERDAAAMQIFGRSARELNPLIEAGSKGLKEFGKEAEEMGYVMSGDTLAAFGQLDDAMQRFTNQTTTMKNSLAIVLLPVLTGLFEVLNKIDPKVIATVAIIASVAIVAITVVKGIKDITETFKALDTKSLKTTAIVVGVTAALIALAAIIAVIIGKGDDLNKTMASVGGAVGNMANTVNGAGSQVRYSYASGIDYVPSDRVALIHKGERVQTADENPYNPTATNAGRGGDIYYVTIDAKNVKEFTDVVRLVQGQRQTNRAGRVAIA